jgi:hypothetical protein
MKPIRDWLRRLERLGAFARPGVAVLALSLGLGVAQADTSGFTGDFAPSNWTNSPPGLGAVYFTNSNSELVLTGPNQPASQTDSFDPITYNGPLSGGLTVGGRVEFDWEYNSGDALSTISAATFAWSQGGGGGTTQTNLAQGGPGVVESGVFITPELAPGTTFGFLLSTETPANKLSGSLIVTNFQFQADVPEPSTTALLAGMGMLLGVKRWRQFMGIRGRGSCTQRRI